MSEDHADQPAVRRKPPSRWGNLFLGLFVGGLVGAGALYVTKVDPSLIAGMMAQPQVVETPAAPVGEPEDEVEAPIPHEGLPQTPFEMGNLAADEAVESIKITLGVGTEGAALSEALDVHLGLGFPLRLYPLGGKGRDPSFAAFAHKSSLTDSQSAIQPGQMASFEFSVKEDDVGADELRTASQLLSGVTIGDLQSIGFASQARSDWVLAGYRIEVNGKLFAANGLVNAHAQKQVASSRESLLQMLPAYEEKVNKDKLTAEEEAALKTEHALVRALSGHISGAAPWYEEADAKFQAAAVAGTRVKKLRVTLKSGDGARPGTRNPLYLRAGARKFLLSSESDPLVDETDLQIFELAGFELSLNPLTKEALAQPGVGVIGSGAPGDKVPDRAQLAQVRVEADGEAVYDSDKQAGDKKALPSFWLTPVAHYDDAGGLVKTPLAQGEVPLWTAGMKGVIPAAGIVPEPPPKVAVGPPKTLPPPPIVPPQRRIGSSGLPLRRPGLVSLLNALRNLLRPLTPPAVPIISAVRIAAPNGILCVNDVPTVTWTVGGNTSQIARWTIQLAPVVPDLPVPQLFVPLTVNPLPFSVPTVVGLTNFNQLMTGYPISVNQVPANLRPYVYVRPVVTAFAANGRILASSTGALRPLFPFGSTVATVGLVRGAARPAGPAFDPRPQSPAPSFQFTDFTPGVPNPTSPWTALGYTAPAAGVNRVAWGLNTIAASHNGLNFDTHEVFAAPIAAPLAAINTAARPVPGNPPVAGGLGPEIVRLRFEGFVPVPTTPLATLRLVAHVGFTGGTDPAALGNVVAARAELSGGPLTPGLFLTNGNIQNQGRQPFFTIESPSLAGTALPQFSRRSPMLRVDVPLKLTNLSTGNFAGYGLNPAYSILTTNRAGQTFDVTVAANAPLAAASSAALARQIARGRVYVTVNFYVDLQTTDTTTSVGVFGVRLVPE